MIRDEERRASGVGSSRAGPWVSVLIVGLKDKGRLYLPNPFAVKIIHLGFSVVSG